MNNAEIIKGLNKAIEDLSVIRDALADTEDNTTAPAKAAVSKPAIGGAKKAPAPAAKPVAKSAPAEDTTPTTGDTYTTAELNGMKYNEFKKLASTLGVDCKGTRDEIMSRVVALGVVTDAYAPAEAPAPAEKKAPAKSAPAKPGKSDKPVAVAKGGIKKADAPARDEFDDKADEIAAETPAKDIISALSDVGVKANNLNFKSKLAEALRDGLLEIDGEDDSTEAEAEGGEEEVDGNSYFSEYDVHEVNDPDKMGEARAAACADKQTSIIEAVANGELTADDIVDFLQNNATQEELDLLGEDYTEDDLTKLYCEVSKHFIDEDGDEHEPGEAYMVGESAFCCGMPLNYDDKTGKFLCSHCAGEYDAE